MSARFRPRGLCSAPSLSVNPGVGGLDGGGGPFLERRTGGERHRPLLLLHPPGHSFCKLGHVKIFPEGLGGGGGAQGALVEGRVGGGPPTRERENILCGKTGKECAVQCRP